MSKTYLEAVRRKDQVINPLFTFLGIEVQSIAQDRAVLCLPYRPELIQGSGLVAGGILATLLDETMAHAVLGGNQPGQRTATVDMSVSYLRPAMPGNDLVCEAQVIKRGGRVLFVEAIVFADDNEVARSTGSFLLIS